MINKDLVAASATPIVLSILSHGENYGYAIIKRVKELSGGKIEWTEGMLYPVLHRLENQKLIKSNWKVPETGRKRKYYEISKKGIEELEKHHNQWIQVYSTLQRSMENNPCLT